MYQTLRYGSKQHNSVYRDHELLAEFKQAVRALAWLGPEKAEAALTTLKRKMPPGVFGELVAVAPQLPTWLAQSVGRVAYEPREMTK